MQHRANEASKRLQSIHGIGIIGASAIVATVTDPKAFRSGRDFAAWIGLVPREASTGGKQKLGPISKQGDRYLRRILVVGVHSVLRARARMPGMGGRTFRSSRGSSPTGYAQRMKRRACGSPMRFKKSLCAK